MMFCLGNTTFEGGMLSGFADNIKQHYAEKKRISFLDQGRRLLSKYDFTPEIPDHTPKRGKERLKTTFYSHTHLIL
jgi:hypothetical protein